MLPNLDTNHTDEIRTILDAAPFPLIISRVSDGTVLYANDSLADLVGLKSDTLVGRSTPDFYADPGDRSRLLSEIQRVGHVTNYELRLRHVDGHELWVLASIVVTKLRGDDVLVAGLNDISERKTIERALSDSERRFRSLVESANDIIYTMTLEGIMTYISPSWKDILGHDISEVLNTSFAPLIHPDDIEKCFEFLQSVVETGSKRSGIEYRVKHKDGHWRWHTSNAACLKDDQGNVEAFIGIARDITDKKNAQLALEKAHRDLRETQVKLIQSEKMGALGQLVAGIAHELNTPVGAICSMQSTLSKAISMLQAAFAEAAPKSLSDNRTIQRAFAAISEADRVITKAAGRVSDTVKNLRSFAKLDEAELKKTDLHEGIDNVLTLIQHNLGDRIEVVRDYSDFPPIICYPRKLNQVFLNILMNATEAIEGNGRITITTSQKEDKVHVAIRDTGMGIPQQDLVSIFDPGFTTKRVGVGTGLGLAICYQIMQEHGGEMQVASELGKGSTFSIVLPVQPGR